MILLKYLLQFFKMFNFVTDSFSLVVTQHHVLLLLVGFSSW